MGIATDTSVVFEGSCTGETGEVGEDERVGRHFVDVDDAVAVAAEEEIIVS